MNTSTTPRLTKVAAEYASLFGERFAARTMSATQFYSRRFGVRERLGFELSLKMDGPLLDIAIMTSTEGYDEATFLDVVARAMSDLDITEALEGAAS